MKANQAVVFPHVVGGRRMSKRPLLKPFRVIALLVMAMGLLSFAHHGSTAHLPLQLLAGQDHHGHWHDEDGYELWDDHDSGHAASHNSGDHSHVAMTGLPPPVTVAPVMFRIDWQGGGAAAPYASPLYSLERPPRSVRVV